MPANYAPHVLALLLAALLAGCSTAGDPPAWTGPKQTLEVHLQNHFEDDHVRVAIDNHTVFSGAVTTDYVWSLAEIIELNLPMGAHRLTVTRNQGPSATLLFTLDRPLYIGVKYFEEPLPRLSIPQGFRFAVRDRPYVYD